MFHGRYWTDREALQGSAKRLARKPDITTYYERKRDVRAYLKIVAHRQTEPYKRFTEYPMHRAAREDDKEWCRALLAIIECDATDSRGWTPIRVAAALDNRRAAAVLIEASAEMDSSNHAGNNALILAVDNMHIDMVSLLCEAGVNVNACCKERGLSSALVTAVRRNHLELISLLLVFSADAAGVDAARWSPLVAAMIGGGKDESIIDALLEAGANSNVLSHGLNPISLAAEREDVSGLSSAIYESDNIKLSSKVIASLHVTARVHLMMSV